jgi:hypothetical protein
LDPFRFLPHERPYVALCQYQSDVGECGGTSSPADGTTLIVIACRRLCIFLMFVLQSERMDSLGAQTRQSAEQPDYRQTVKIRVLGPVVAVADGQQLTLGGQKQRTVLALLVAGAGTAIWSDNLIQGVWGEDAPPGTRRSLSTYLSNLPRRANRDGGIWESPRGHSFGPAPHWRELHCRESVSRCTIPAARRGYSAVVGNRRCDP